jgi:hypothetical protein
MIPPEFGYGNKSVGGGVIPPDSTLSKLNLLGRTLLAVAKTRVNLAVFEILLESIK